MLITITIIEKYIYIYIYIYIIYVFFISSGVVEGHDRKGVTKTGGFQQRTWYITVSYPDLPKALNLARFLKS